MSTGQFTAAGLDPPALGGGRGHVVYLMGARWKSVGGAKAEAKAPKNPGQKG